MPKAKLDAVLDNIITLTSETDSNALEITLAQTLFTLAGIDNMLIHSAGNITRAQYALLNSEPLSAESAFIPESLVGALVMCLENAEVSTVEYQKKSLTLFPLMCAKAQPLAIIIVEEGEEKRNHELVIQLLKIYHNFLALMNENERDTLTGLLNRKTFDQKINTIITDLENKHQEIESESSYLAIFDIDHFKRVNDTHGHLMGDEVLLLFSRLMDKSFRDQDFLFRFGGEEFVGVFECPSDEMMSSILNRFRQAIENYNFPQIGKVTVSGGFTKVAKNDLSSKIIDRADVALYHAKNNGRNQVFQHEQLVKAGTVTDEKNDSSGEIELF